MQNDTEHSGYNEEKGFSGGIVSLHAHEAGSPAQYPAIHENEEHAPYGALQDAQKYNDAARGWGDEYSPAWTREEYSYL